jgi:putative addiction module killer protein
MFSVRKTEQFSRWLDGISDQQTRIRLVRRLRKVQRGLLGDVRFVGNGIYEMREFFGPGWRMYYLQTGDTVILMLGGGDKSTQSKDIEQAIALAESIRSGNDHANQH